MKKIIYSGALTLISALSMAQNSVPNGNFESWTSGTYDVPNFYIGSNQSTFFNCNSPFNCVKTTDAYHGTYALQLTTNVGTDTCIGYITNANTTQGGNPCQWSGGTAYAQQPTGLHGYYKSNIPTGDSAGIFVAFKKAGSCLGLFLYKFSGVHSTYTPFSFTFPSTLSTTPDTMIFGAVSSDVFDNVQKNGSTIQLDSLAFTGNSVTQPANFNGDFENWQSQATHKPNSWYLNTDNQGSGILQTTDNKAGTYAMELKNFFGYRGSNNSIPASNASGISTGYYIHNCSGGPNCQAGGYPFSNQIDTLTFYYKYVPSGNDSAQTSLTFKKSGSYVFGTGNNLSASSAYKYVEIPFNVYTAVDTVIVSFQSSIYKDSAVSFLGSDFKIDEVYFKSQIPQTTGIKNTDSKSGIGVYPNPTNDGSFTLSHVQPADLLLVYNVYGQEVQASITKDANGAHVQIDTPGAYMVYVNSRGKVTMQKVLVSKN